MATSKTLTPTNVAIQIPDFTDQPDQRVNSNCIDKIADAINALNSQMVNKAVIGDKITVQIDTSSVGIKTGTFTVPTAPSGYTLAAYIGVGNSYRLCFLGCGGDTVYAYVGTAYGYNIDVYFYPIFKKT